MLGDRLALLGLALLDSLNPSALAVTLMLLARPHANRRVAVYLGAVFVTHFGLGVLLMAGLELAAEVKARCPEVRVVILTTFARSGYLRRALDAGASGYLLKDAPAAALAAAVRRVAAGGRAVDPELAAEAWGEPDSLSDRERLCLRLAGQRRTGPEIAAELGLSVGTVRNYLSEAIGKLGVGNRVEAARLAREKGWL